MGEKQAPFVAVRTDIRKEERVLVIADIAGYSRHEALGRLVDLWAWCADRKLEDAPEDCPGYAVSDAVVCRFLGRHGVEAILGGHCDELALGERRDDGLIYLRGTSDTVSRLRAHRNSASAGGKARNRVSQGARNEGRFVSKRTKGPAARVLSTSCEGAVHQPATSQPPAVTSEIPDPQSTILEELSLAPQTAKRPTSAHAAAVEAFDARYRAKFGSKPTWGPKQGKAISDLLKQHEVAEVTKRIEILFESPPPFLANGPPDIGTLVQHFDKLAAPYKAQKPGADPRQTEIRRTNIL